MFSLMIHGGHDGSDHCRKNAGYSSFLQCHHLHIQHESPKSSFNESHDCDFIYKVEKKACINSRKRKAIVYSDGIKAVMFYSVIKKCSTSRHYSWWLNLHVILGYLPSMN